MWHYATLAPEETGIWNSNPGISCVNAALYKSLLNGTEIALNYSGGLNGIMLLEQIRR